MLSPALHPREITLNICRAALCLLFVVIPSPPRRARDLLFLSVAQSPDSAERAPSTARPAKPAPETGYAAFYSKSLEGHKTSCGGVYSSTELTAAHPTLRCGTKLRVTNLRNGKSVRVTVNDHGPASHNRIIDLSYAAAQSLDFIPQGTTLVKVEVLR